jgi:preprotein translocase subunit SecA
VNRNTCHDHPPERLSHVPETRRYDRVLLRQQSVEFAKIYNLDVTSIPNSPQYGSRPITQIPPTVQSRRSGRRDTRRYVITTPKGSPVLVGTISGGEI